MILHTDILLRRLVISDKCKPQFRSWENKCWGNYTQNGLRLKESTVNIFQNKSYKSHPSSLQTLLKQFASICIAMAV